MTDRELRRMCDWCEKPIPATARRDSITCSTPCRQARHRFRSGRAVRPGAPLELGPMRVAYADPPYLGRCGRYYEHVHPDGLCWDDLDTHRRLVDQLAADYPDGWALSLSADSLRSILPLCPVDVDVAAWRCGERPSRSFGPLSSWEPVIYRGGRPLEPVDGAPRRVDSLEHASRARTTDPRRIIGAKPAAFCYWLFDLLGARPGDDFVDLFAGSGGVARAWRYYASLGPEHDDSLFDLVDAEGAS